MVERAASDAMLAFAGVSHRFGDLPVLEHIDLKLARGGFVALVGPSGCGKTTLLNLAAGLAQPDAGAVYYDGARLLAPNTSAGYLTQDDALLPWRDVLANVALPLEIKGVDRKTRFARARDIIAKVGLAGFEHHRPSELSGGMRKRVSLARTLIYRPETLLLDEPFGALDAQTRVLMQKQLLDLTGEFGLTVLLVTHDIGEAIALADRIVLLTGRPGRIAEVLAVPHAAERDVLRRERRNDDLYAHVWDHLAAGASRLQRVTILYLPASFGWMVIATRLAMPYAFVAAVSTEVIASTAGLGHLVKGSATVMNSAGMFAAMLALLFVSLVASLLANQAAARSRWKL